MRVKRFLAQVSLVEVEYGWVILVSGNAIIDGAGFELRKSSGLFIDFL